MLRALIIVVAALALTTDGASAGPGGGTPAAFVTLERDSELVGVDLTAGRVVARIGVPAGPTSVVSYSARYLVVASPRAGAVTLVDAFTQKVLKTWRDFGRPQDVAVAGPSWAYVADEGRSQLVVLDLVNRKVLRRIAIRPAPIGVAVGDAVLVTHGRASRQLTIAELGFTVPPRVLRFRHAPVGGAANDISRQADTAHAYVTYRASGVVGALDWGRERMLWRRTVGGLINDVEVDHYRGWQLWAADRRAGGIVLLSARNGHTLRRLRGCPGAHHVTPVGTAWVVASCQHVDALAVWSQRTWQGRLVRVGAGPHGVAEIVLP